MGRIILLAGVAGCFLPPGRCLCESPGGSKVNPLVMEGTRTHTAHSGGKWRVYFNAHGARIAGANRSAIWFRKGANVWRYNVATKTVDVCTSPMTHAKLSYNGYEALADDGRFTLGDMAANYLWTPGKGWSRLSQPVGNTNRHLLALDAKGRLWALYHLSAFAWEKAAWAPSRRIPNFGGVYPVGAGWLFWHNQGQGKEWPAFTWWDRTFENHTKYPKAIKQYHFMRQCYRIGPAAVGLFTTMPKGKTWEDRVLVLCRITAKSFVKLIEGSNVGLDLATGEVFRCEPNAELTRGAILTAEGKGVTGFPLPTGFDPKRNFLLRDANGHYWFGYRRWDGRAWQAVMPSNAFDLPGPAREAIAAGRLRFDEKQKAWIDTWKGIPHSVYAYDAKTRIGWLQRNPRQYPDPAVWDRIHFAPDGSRKLLQSVTIERTPSSFPVPRFQDAAGNWWFGSRWRWDGKKVHSYDDGGSGTGSPKLGRPAILQGAKGSVWMYHSTRVWKKFNPRTSRFQAAVPYDEFAFTFGAKTLSIVARAPDKWSDHHSDLGRIFVKSAAGKWQPMANPFVGEQFISRGNTFGRVVFYGYTPRLIRGTRMLVSCYMGVFEHDRKSGRWAYLMPYSNQWAFFDEKGRRVMVSNDTIGRILVYEGEALDMKPARAGEKQLIETMERLLKQMDADFWPARETATKAMTNLIRKRTKTVGRFLADRLRKGGLSLEVRRRIQIVLEDGEPASVAVRGSDIRRFLWRSRVGNSLFERMRRPMTATFPGGYVIRPGMRYDSARSIFHAAGAKYSSAIHNKHYPDMSYKGYLLPDNTMVYLRIQDRDGRKHIQSMGIGLAGGGYNKDWPWGDKKKNSLGKLHLKPNVATLSD